MTVSPANVLVRVAPGLRVWFNISPFTKLSFCKTITHASSFIVNPINKTERTKQEMIKSIFRMIKVQVFIGMDIRGSEKEYRM